MRFLDMFRMSGSSLWKRKVRTFLTVLGVMIGTASIVVMISIGLGLSRASMAEIEKYGGIMTVTVSEEEYYDFGSDSETQKSDVKVNRSGHMDDELIDEILKLDHVKSVYPIIDTSAIVFKGRYQANVNVRGMYIPNMKELGFTLSTGEYPQENSAVLQVVYGNTVLADFYDDKNNKGYYYDGVLPDIDYMNDTMMYIFNTENYYNYMYGGDDGSGAVVMPKKYIVDTAGVMSGSVDDFGNYSYFVFCDIERLKAILKKEYKNVAIPGQPTTSSGKPLKEIFYTSLQVNVDSMDAVQEVQSEINKLGYHASSNAEWVASMQAQTKYIELALGGIGAISLLVAAIGIANTMMMSIYERTKEIGVMKVLGCDLKNIQGLFLMEAGYIGFLGGVIGIGLSYALSAIINTVMKGMEGMDSSLNVGISYIPPWLSLVAMVFAVFVGMVAGFFPSLRAMRLSPLAAIRNE